METRSRQIAEWMLAQVETAGVRGIVVGLSGGIDSAVVAGLAQLAMPDRVVGVLLPCHSDPRDEDDARLAAEHFAIPTIRIDLAPAYDRLLLDLRTAVAHLPEGQRPLLVHDEVDPKARVPVANVKPRLRMASLYFVANSLDYLVAGTGNRAELAIGYFTKYGDGGVDILPIGSLLKSEVRALARELLVPDPIIEKAPSAGLWQGQTDEAEMGFTYAELEWFLKDGPGAVNATLAERIEAMARASAHKRALPPVFAEDG
jgi:NAD+ synthase